MQQVRNVSKYLDRDRTSKAIREKFLDYFIKEHNHVFVRSSPVVPYCDPTVAFVNAGMNQFKGLFLGTQEIAHKRVANSQKCVRVGGKHNDLNIVGTDGYHHTFFEMLGNWSFGDYFKRDACKLAWSLLTDVYKLDKNRLYVTYFNGDGTLGLKPDLETFEIWKSIGLPAERILPFASKDNFWEMGSTGPCGPCSEIHYDHLGTNNRGKYVNKGLPDLVEIWNVVFIEYNRNIDGSLTTLPIKHIDTGMGLERLTSVLQNVRNNYETDIFSTLFTAIERICPNVPKYQNKYGEKDWNLLDTSYRILADHSRMITVCLSDGIIPEQNQKLRRVLRKVFQLSESTFAKEKGLLKELSNYVVDNLGHFYPELEQNIKLVHQIIDYEEDIYKSLRANVSEQWQKIVKETPALANLDLEIETPGLVAAYKEIQEQNWQSITPERGFKLYDTFGLDKESIQKLSDCLNLNFNENTFDNEIELLKQRTKDNFAQTGRTNFVEQLLQQNVMKTDDSFKYEYINNSTSTNMVFKPVNVKILRMLTSEGFVPEIAPHLECILILDKTNLYSEAGGQQADCGTINFDDSSKFEIHNVQSCNGYIFHTGFFKTKNSAQSLKTGQEGTLEIDYERRVGNTLNHTATHLLNAVVKKMKGATCQKSSKVTENFLNLDLCVFGGKLTTQDLTAFEDRIQKLINKSVPVQIAFINSQEFLALDNVTLIPGEIYPDNNIRLVEIRDHDEFKSLEPCCGTHALNTKNLSQFSIANFKSLGRGSSSITAITGRRAELANKNGVEVLADIDELDKSINDNIDKPDVLDMAVASIKRRLNYDVEDDNMVLPFVVKQFATEKLNNIQRKIKNIARNNLKEFIEIEMQNAIQTKISTTNNNKEYLVYYLRSSVVLDNVPLQKATKFCPDVPILVVSLTENAVKARCCVPKNFVNQNFNAELWLKQLSQVFKAQIAPPRGQDSAVVCNMKERKVNILEWETLLKEGVQVAHEYAEKYL